MTLLNNILPEERRKKLRAKLEAGEFVRAIEAHNGLSGIVANNAFIEGETTGGPIRVEFDALWESSLTDSASKGHPDIEIVGIDSRLHTINEILAVTNKPMVVDGDTGGEANKFEYTVAKLERAGVSAVIIEDKIFPKRNSLESGTQQTLEDPHVFANKIRRGKKIQTGRDFMIIARIEALIAGKSMEVALERARIYLDAGADGILIHSKSKEPEEILEFARHYKIILKEVGLEKPLICVPTTYNAITEDELKTAGFNMVIHANHLLRSCYKTMTQVARTILLNERSFEADPECSPLRDIFHAVGFMDVKEKDQQEGLLTRTPVIIPAAGEDQTFKTLLNGKPKAMLQIKGKSLLARQVDALNENGLNDIYVVAGYGKDQLRDDSVKVIENTNYQNGSMLHSIFTARKQMRNGFLMLYADILLGSDILAKLRRCKEDVVLVVDNAFQYHKNEAHGLVDFVIGKKRHSNGRRQISFVCENFISKIGNKINPETATHEFIGLAKFTKTGSEQFKQTFDDCVKNYQGRFQEADDIAHFTFTDLIQEMVDRGFRINFMEIHKNWMEIHSPEDIDLANKMLLESL
tara:strand:- start:760 stop:2499 length:1740 start_codon:yes stop_codon:yes gene_type:complete